MLRPPAEPDYRQLHHCLHSWEVQSGMHASAWGEVCGLPSLELSVGWVVVEITGFVEDGYGEIADAFRELELGEEVGAGFSLVHDGKLVVDLTGGTADDRPAMTPRHSNSSSRRRRALPRSVLPCSSRLASSITTLR